MMLTIFLFMKYLTALYNKKNVASVNLSQSQNFQTNFGTS